MGREEEGAVCHLPKGIVAEEPDWAAFLFVKTPAECGSLDKSPSRGTATYAGKAPFFPQHWIP